MIMLFISILINACVKIKPNDPGQSLLYKGRIISTIDSLPKANTRFKVWEGKSTGLGGIVYEETYFSTDKEGKFSCWKSKLLGIKVTREQDLNMGRIIFTTTSPSVLLVDTIFFNDIYYKP
jgi:hypothetical protein